MLIATCTICSLYWQYCVCPRLAVDDMQTHPINVLFQQNEPFVVGHIDWLAISNQEHLQTTLHLIHSVYHFYDQCRRLR